MRKTALALVVSLMTLGVATSYSREQKPDATPVGISEKKMSISNESVKRHAFLQCMYDDEYFPKHLVDNGKQILLRLCERIEKEKPADNAALYAITHAATDSFNELAEEFFEADSEIETAARECIASDLEFIASAYGFEDVDAEELIATRDW